MKFWDSSAIVPLTVAERSSAAAEAIHAQDPTMVVWWATPAECVSALTRRDREGQLDSRQLAGGLDRLDGLAAGWLEVEPTQRVRQLATRLLRVHPLRSGDALQLASALVAAEDVRSLPFVTLDDRLAMAAEREGFPVVTPGWT